jgi:uncharacterized protein (TIGR02271 family)
MHCDLPIGKVPAVIVGNSSMNMKTTDPNEQRTRPSRKEDEHIVVPVIEERSQVGKKVVEKGRVSVSKTITEREESITVPLKHEEVQVERVKRNEFVNGDIPQIRQEGDTTIIPVLREEVVVTKRLLLVEELHVTRTQKRTKEPVNVKLRSEKAKVVRKRPSPSDPSDE